jgi:lysophospholipase L1-like esterase
LWRNFSSEDSPDPTVTHVALGSMSRTIVVGCVGDSITEGYGCPDPDRTSYPAVLERILNEESKQRDLNVKFEVFNFGVSGTTATSGRFDSYNQTEQYEYALKSKANMYFVMLGTNDYCRATPKERYVQDFSALISEFVGLENKPIVRVMVPPPLYYDKQETLNLEAPLAVREIASSLELGEVVDVFEALGGADLKSPKLFPDGCHPNNEGYAVIARTVADRVLEELKKISNL